MGALLGGAAALGAVTLLACDRDPLGGPPTPGNLGPGQGSTVQGGASGSGAGGGPSISGTDGGAAPPGCAPISTAPGVMNPCGRTFGVAFSPDGQLLATATETPSPNIHLWRVSDGAFVRDVEGHGRDGSYSVAFSPDGTLLATAGLAPRMASGSTLPQGVNDPTVVRIWDVATGALLRDIPAATGFYASSAQFSHDGALLATSGYYGPVQVWRLSDATPLTSIDTVNTVYTARLSPDDTRLVTASNVTGGVWNVSEGKPLFPIANLGPDMNDAAFSPDGSRLATTGDAGHLQVFDSAGTLLQSFAAHDVNYTSRVVWVGNDRLVSDDWGGNVKSWTRDATGSFAPSGSWSLGTQALGLAVSPDKTRLVVGCDAGIVFLPL
jgi:WD40 repeat protein